MTRQGLLGLPIERAAEILEGQGEKLRVLYTKPANREPRGSLRVVRIKETGEAVELTVSYFEDEVDQT